MIPKSIMGPILAALLTSPLPPPIVAQTSTKYDSQAKMTVGGEDAKQAFARFLRDPSSSTVREFYLSISSAMGVKCDKTEILDHIFGYSHRIGPLSMSKQRYRTLAIEMLSGDLDAARSVVKILGFIDRGWRRPRAQTTPMGHEVGLSLGELIRVDPELFLRACHEEREDPFLVQKGFPVGFIPSFMKRKSTRAAYELVRRREAIQSVEDPGLRAVRDECVQVIDREIEMIEDIPADGTGKKDQEVKKLDETAEAVKNVLLDIINKPSPENFKKLLALIDVQTEYHRYFVDAIMILSKGMDREWPPPALKEMDPLGTILHEARCGNEPAIDVLLSAFPAAEQLDVLVFSWIRCVLSDLILIKPASLIERLAKYEGTFSEPLIRDLISPVCQDYGVFEDYGPNRLAGTRVILRRRITALEALNMPEHKELLERCIRLIEGALNAAKDR